LDAAKNGPSLFQYSRFSLEIEEGRKNFCQYIP